MKSCQCCNTAVLSELCEGKRESVVIGVHITLRIPTIVISAARRYRLVKRCDEIETTTCCSRLIHNEIVNGWNGRAVKQGSAHPPLAIRQIYALRRPNNVACDTWCTRRHWRWATHTQPSELGTENGDGSEDDDEDSDKFDTYTEESAAAAAAADVDVDETRTPSYGSYDDAPQLAPKALFLVGSRCRSVWADSPF